jgi:hypothetical protein
VLTRRFTVFFLFFFRFNFFYAKGEIYSLLGLDFVDFLGALVVVFLLFPFFVSLGASTLSESSSEESLPEKFGTIQDFKLEFQEIGCEQIGET